MIVHVRFIDLPLRPNFARPIRIHAVARPTRSLSRGARKPLCFASSICSNLPYCSLRRGGVLSNWWIVGYSETDPLQGGTNPVDTRISAEASGSWHVIR